jgi:tetratricopeptide (TPR) repeat protein
LALLAFYVSMPAAVYAQGAAFAPMAAQPANLPQPNKAAIASYNAGVTFMQQNKVDQAAEQFRQAIQASPDFVNAHCNLGTALMLQGEATAAEKELHQAVTMNPTLSAAWATLGSCYQAQGKETQAIDALNKYLQLNPKGELAPKIRSLIASLKTELSRSGGVNDASAQDYMHEATIGGMVRWSSMPITVYIKPGTDVPGYRSEYLDLLHQAFDDWEQASDGKINFEFVNDPNAQITCSWTNTTKNAISSAEGGQTMVVPDPAKQGNILNAAVSLLTVPPTGNELSSGYAKRVDLHEVGHALGILGHSTNPADVMFYTVLPGVTVATLTSRDKKTIVNLYSDEAVKTVKQGVDPNKMISGDPNSTMNKVLVLNNDARTLIEKGNYPLAIEKLEQAHKLDPANQVVCSNLGSMYGNMGVLAMAVHNFTGADTFFKKAIPLLQHGTNKMNLAQILKGYSQLLHMTNRAADAAKIDSQLKAMGGS